MPFSAVVDTNTINGLNGLISGPPFTGIGQTATIVRDINGDGIADIVIGARNAGDSANYAGTTYVVFGTAAGIGNLDLSSLDGSNGFRLTGENAYDFSGRSVASAGDVNGDGIGDLIIGAHQSDPNGYSAGTSYVVFGADAGFPATFDLGSLDGDNGFRIIGPAGGAYAGYSVSGAGDVNGDGKDDLIIGASGASAAYVVFGGDALGATINLASLDGSQGFKIDMGPSGGGYSVSGAGDFNGDGFADLLVANHLTNNQSGAAYVVFGGAAVGAGGNVAQGGLNGADGFTLTGAASYNRLGYALASAGDVNGDGFDDIVVGAPGASAAYVVFGTDAGMPATLNISALDGSNGFKVIGANTQLGFSVSGAGDLNGDGVDDLVVGAPMAGPIGVTGAPVGGAFIVFGRTDGFAPVLDVSSLDGLNGVTVIGRIHHSGVTVATGGDINNDGLDDLILGDPGLTGTGYVYVIHGQQAPLPIIEAGTGGNDSYIGAALNDQLSGAGGNDILRGMGGDDILDGGDLSDQLFGGDGLDQLFGGLGGDIMYGDAGDDILDGGDGADKLFGGTGADQLNGGTGNDRMAGEADIDTLRGGAGNDYLDGGIGADIMYGGADNDIYIVDDALDQTIELANEGYDIVRTTLSWTLSDNVEALELQGSANASGTGNSGANNLQGNSGNNTLSGLAGVDTINGNDGDDIIIGGAGNDLLRGGTGADTFRVDHAFSGVLETDQIYDFSTAEGDRMDFRDAYSGTLSVVSAFTRHAGEMILSFAAGVTTVRLDIDGNGQPECQVKINGDVTGDWGGWLL